MLTEKQKFLTNVTKFHHELENFVLQEYGIKAKYSTTIAWGYQTTTVYLETENKQKYIAKLTQKKADIKVLEQDIYLSHYLHKKLPTPQYLQSNAGRYVNKFEGYLLRVQHYIEGTPPFDLTPEVYCAALKFLKTIHETPPPKYINLPTLEKGTAKTKLLHGDLTPSNILISYGKISGILDFELSLLGPIEYDLARTLVFSWFRMEKETYESLLKLTLNTYKSPTPLDMRLLKDFAVLHIEQRLKAIKQNESDHASHQEWLEDLEFTQKKLSAISLT